ncbi:MAG: hypothetical protein WC654_02725 [Patescibacteria group bacterium]
MADKKATAGLPAFASAVAKGYGGQESYGWLASRSGSRQIRPTRTDLLW